MKYRESRPDLYRASLLAAVFVVLQGASGAVVVWSQLDFYATMSHGMFVSLYFGALAYMCFHVLPRPEAARESTPAIDRQRAALPAD